LHEVSWISNFQETSMRKLSPAYVVASVVIAVAGSPALAQTKAASTRSMTASAAAAQNQTGGRSDVTTGTTMRGSSQRTNSNAPANDPNSNRNVQPTDNSTVTLNNTSTTDVRNQQNLQATEGTRTSGTTSASATGTTTTTAGASSTGTTTTGVRPIGASSVNSTGATSTGTTGTATGTQTTTTNAGTNFGMLNTVVGGGLAESDRVVDENAPANGQGSGATVGTAGSTALDMQRSAASLDKVIQSAKSERRKIGKNGQLLYSIAPRTNADRSQEVPDDGPTPALKGYAPPR
jgi:hypothetical protein